VCTKEIFENITNYQLDLDSYSEQHADNFQDALIDANVLHLKMGDSINEYGMGGVNITCTEMETYTDDENGYCIRQVFSLEFQADQSPCVEFTYQAFTDTEIEETGEDLFKYWISAKYIDEDGNQKPWDNSYFDEFVEDFS